MRTAIDSNILVYAFIRESDDRRHSFATDLMIRAALADTILPAQVLGEYANVIRRKFPQHGDYAVKQVVRWSEMFTVVPTTEIEIERGARMALRYDLQTWDAIICQAARTGGASYLLSEDMQDGLTIDGLTVVNPFNPANAALIEALLTPTDAVERP